MDLFSERTSKLYNQIKGWPLPLFRRFNPIVKIAVILATIAVWVLDPLDIVALSIWGFLAVTMSHSLYAFGVIVLVGIIFWVGAAVITFAIAFTITTYVVPWIVGGFCILFDKDPTPVLFERRRNNWR